jgi:hypothetical protein
MGFMNARRLILAAVVSLSSLAAGGLLAAPAALAEELCPNAASRQGPSGSLPDCRAYEQVTPVEKGDSEDQFGTELQLGSDAFAVAEDGDGILVFALASYEGGEAFNSGYVFKRGTSGWTTTTLSPGPGVYLQEPSVFDPENLSEVGSFNTEDTENLFTQVGSNVIGPPGGPYTTLPGAGPLSGFQSETYAVGASADLSHVILASENHELAPGDTGQDPGGPGSFNFALYEWANGHLQLVNVATNGSLLSPCGAIIGTDGDGHQPDAVFNTAVSRDGSRVVFIAPEPFSGISGLGCYNEKTGENPPQLYMRVDGARTLDISEPNADAHDSGPPLPAVFVGASADDSKVFFISRAELTADDHTHANELYEYNTEAPEGERLVRVSRGESGTAEGDVDFVGGVSSDGSTVYFTAFGKLASGASEAGEAGEPNLYRYDTATGQTTYITSAPSESYPYYKGDAQISDGPGCCEAYLDEEEARPGAHPEEVGLERKANWYTTGNGQYLLFDSALPLTGDTELAGDEELFRYSAADNSIVCVSCASGVQSGRPSFGAEAEFGAESAPMTRPMSENGSYVFFQTSSALVPSTTAQKVHVYEWHNGKLSLISSPDDPGNAYFLGTDPGGSNVFFATHAQLVPQDTDFDGDIYDARVDGGFVGVTPSLCTGTGCQGVPAAPPIFATPASVTFEGVGNFPPGTVAAEQKPVKSKAPTKTQSLARALRTCKRDRAKRKRARCEASARARYGRAHGSTKSADNGGRGN